MVNLLGMLRAINVLSINAMVMLLHNVPLGTF